MSFPNQLYKLKMLRKPQNPFLLCVIAKIFFICSLYLSSQNQFITYEEGSAMQAGLNKT